MGYQTISIVVSDAVSDLPALNAAIAIAQREKGHLNVFCLGIDPVRYDMAPLGAAPALALAATGEAVAHAKSLMDWAKGQLQGAACPSHVDKLVVIPAGIETAISRVVRYSDLIVASQPYATGSTQMQSSIVEAALFGTGAPVLIVPRHDRDYSAPFERLMVAWNESHESLEAVRKALPALKSADRAEIVMVDPPVHSSERSDPGGAVCQMLARHGVKSEVSILAKTMPRVSDIINRHAMDHANDLIIIGAYGHSRIRESLIGGATREMLETAQVPIMMAH